MGNPKLMVKLWHVTKLFVIICIKAQKFKVSLALGFMYNLNLKQTNPGPLPQTQSAGISPQLSLVENVC